MIGAQSASRSRGIGRYSRGLTRALIAEAQGREVFLALSDAFPATTAAMREMFLDLEHEGRIVEYSALRQINFQSPHNRWRRGAGALAHGAALAALEPDATLSLSLFEGFAEDALTSDIAGARPALRAAIAYDFIPLRLRDAYLADPLVSQWYEEKLRALRSHDLLFAISDSVASDAVALAGVAREQVITIFAGADEVLNARTANSDETRRRFGLTGPYFMHVGSWEPRKNYERLIDAFGLFSRRARRAHQLVLVTEPPEAAASQKAIEAAAVRAGLKPGDIVVTGHVGDDVLRRLYQDARGLIYSSLMEGFGLPVLEAMHVSAAVVGADVSSIPEIIGLKEALFDPHDSSAIAAMMTQLEQDDAFHARLVANAHERREMFSWGRSARRVWRTLECRREGATARPRRREKTTRLATLLKEIATLPREPVGPTAADLDVVSHVAAANLSLYDVAPRPPHGAARWRLEGPVDSSYSLALVNRETARTLMAQGVETQIVSAEGDGPYAPNLAYLSAGHSDIAARLRPANEDAADRPLVVSRNMYPPRVDDMAGDWNILHQYAWEESRFPAPWVDAFNLHLDGAACVSAHVKKTLQDSGVAIPLTVTGDGVDHWDKIVAAPALVWPGKAFRFLHVSSCFPRKGVDAMLEAFGRAFRASDDVSLLVKTFDNPHNDVSKTLARLRSEDPGYPDVALLIEDLPAAVLKSLYKHCHALVAPSRAEGFGLPLAEAMLSGLPVIATGWSGQLDFCKPEWSWLVDFDYAPARTHFRLPGSVWAEPHVADLAEKMKIAAATSAEERAVMADRGRAFLSAHYSWHAVTSRMRRSVEAFAALKAPSSARLGWVTTWNCACGIASFSDHLIARLPNDVVIFGAKDDERAGEDDERVVRAWSKHVVDDDLEELAAEVAARGIDALMIQFNYGFFNFARLSAFFDKMTQAGVPIFVELHSTSDPPGRDDRRLSLLAPALARCARVIVHSHHDLNRLKAIGVIGNVAMLPLGLLDGLPARFLPRVRGRFVIGSYGFCLPHKGLGPLLKAFASLQKSDPSLRLELVNAEYPTPESRMLIDELRHRVAQLGLDDRARLTHDYLPDAESMKRIRLCDLIVFPYESTGESASAAVRFAIASGRPVATNRLPIFDDVAPAVFQIDAGDERALERGLRALIDDLRLGASYVAEKIVASRRWREDHSYDRIAAQLGGMIQAARVDRALAAHLPADDITMQSALRGDA